MEASNVKRGEETLAFELASVGAHFQGKILPGNNAIRGIWEQGGTGLPLRFEKRAAGAEKSLAKPISRVEGTWQGAIETGNMRMRLQLHINHDDSGKLIASVDSLDQAIQGIPASKVTEHAGEVKIELSAFGAEYSGALSATKNEIAGQWSQNGNDEKLDFRRSEQILELRRPQNPVKPYPYKEEEVSIVIGDGKTRLAGTLTLALGIGANTTVFSVVNAVILRPLPYPESDRLVSVKSRDIRGTPHPADLSYPTFFDFRAENTVFEHIVSYRDAEFTLNGTEQPLHLRGQIVSWDLFPMLHVQPALGRGFLPDEEAAAERVVILSHELWRGRFGGDPAMVGSALMIDGQPHTVVGVSPPHFEFPITPDSAQLWTTVAKDAASGPVMPATNSAARGC